MIKVQELVTQGKDPFLFLPGKREVDYFYSGLIEWHKTRGPGRGSASFMHFYARQSQKAQRRWPRAT